MPIDRSKYPDNWDEIAHAVEEEAGWKCKRCGASHLEDGTMGSCLTVHHPDQDPGNHEARTEALCARCHLAEHRKLKNKHQINLPFGGNE